MTSLSSAVQQVVNPSFDTNKGTKHSPAKATTKAKKAKASTKAKTTKVVSAITKARAELKKLSGAPVSPSMTLDAINAKIKELSTKPTIEVKAKVIPSKPVGIGNYCVSRLKAKVAPKEVLAEVKAKFPTAKTSMACVYWYASKINQGLL